MMLGMLMMLAAAAPPNPGRATPPPGLEARALAVGAVAPELSLPEAGGGQWKMQRPAVLVFYRGHW